MKYRVTTSSDDAVWNDQDHTDATLTTTITGLTNGQSYDVQVRASSLAGDSEWSPTATGTPEAPAAQVPDVPEAPTLIAGNAQLSVSWIAPSNNGASITDYDVQYSVTTTSSADAVWNDQDHTDATLTTTITGLTNGQSYDVQVRATNSAGTSDWSDIATGTPALPPDAPDLPTLKPGNAKLVVEWTKPAENGASITDYDVRYQPTSSVDWFYLDFIGAGTSTTITGLTNGLNYTVQVRAENSAGESKWSLSATGTPALQPP